MQCLALLLRASPKVRQTALRASESSAAAQGLLTRNLLPVTPTRDFAFTSTACTAAYLHKGRQPSPQHLAGVLSVRLTKCSGALLTLF